MFLTHFLGHNQIQENESFSRKHFHWNKHGALKITT